MNEKSEFIIEQWKQDLEEWGGPVIKEVRKIVDKTCPDCGYDRLETKCIYKNNTFRKYSYFDCTNPECDWFDEPERDELYRTRKELNKIQF